MAKLPLVSSRYLIKYLAAHGFVHVHTRGSHHVLRRGTRTVVVPERAQVGRGLLLEILAQVGLSRDEFLGDYNKR
ncbi:MAG: type II toxin-antitoxin system HicA family toxin [Thaumarchaeota archaeon]|nr:type II toxin-antitoxin system HicA family toxin [Nitrososphaerota archaeon]